MPAGVTTDLAGTSRAYVTRQYHEAKKKPLTR